MADPARAALISRVSHELRTPLLVMQQTLSLLAERIAGPLSPEQQQFTDLTRVHLAHLQGDLIDFLDFLQFEAARPDLRREPCHLPRLVEQICASLSEVAQAHSVRLIIEIPEALPLAECDPFRFSQALGSLIANAILASPPSGKVTVESGARPDGIELRITGRRPGMSDDALRQLFTAFQPRANDAAADRRGTGVSLLLAQRILDLHQAALSASRVEETVRVLVVLPVPGRGRMAPSRAEHPAGAPAFGQQLTIAVVVLILLLASSVPLVGRGTSGALVPGVLLGALAALLLARAYWRPFERKARRQLQEHWLQLQGAGAELETMAGLKDDFLISINHQLRTPLTTMIGGITLLRDGVMGPMTDDQRAIVTMLGDNTQRLHHLVEEALGLSLLKTGRRPLSREAGDLAAVLRERHAHWQPLAGARAIRLECGELPPVYLDRVAIGQVMDHLLHNALRHAPESSEILVRAQARDREVDVLVRDRGRGLSPEQTKRLMEPFTHLHTPEAPGSQGGGLGLAFCRQVIERHRGAIRAESAEGQGTTIRFTLPGVSPGFLLTEACLSAREDAEGEAGEYGLLLVAPRDRGTLVLRRAEELLRRSTHSGDRFVTLDEQTLLIIAVTDESGMTAMLDRLRAVLAAERLDVRLSAAMSPRDGVTPEALLEAVRRRS